MSAIFVVFAVFFINLLFTLSGIKAAIRTKARTSPSDRNAANVEAVAIETERRAASPPVRIAGPEVVIGIVDAGGTAGVAAKKPDRPRIVTMSAEKGDAIHECMFP